MQTTTNYQLKKPEGTDIVNIEDLNGNFDVIDTQLAGRENLLKNAAAKTSLVDADTVPLSDSAASSGTKKITFANLKKVLKAYFDTLYNKYTHPSYTAKAAGLYKVTVDAMGHVSATAAVAKADITALGIPASNTTYAAMKAATSSAAGAAGLVPAPAAGAQAKFLRGDGTWQTPTNTTYSTATTSAAGLMSAADKTKLDGIATGANKYTLPTASASTLGGIKIGSGLSIASGVVSTVKSTKTTATLSAASWSGTAAPYTYSVTVSGHANTKDLVELIAGDSITAAQLETLQAANIAKAEWTANTMLKLYAYGKKPTVNVPIGLVIRKDI